MNNDIKYTGLTAEQVKESREKHGMNVLTPPAKESLWKRFFESLTGPLGHLIPGWQDGDMLVFILELAALLSICISLSEYNGWFGLPVSPDGARVFFESAGIIMAIILASGVAFLAEVKAEKEFEVLNQVNDDEPVTVVRDGKPKQIAKKDIVVDDIILLSTGEEVPADARLLSATQLSVDESTLTGELLTHKQVVDSTDVEHDNNTDTFPIDCVYRGTKVMEGHAIAKVFAVGDNTENGKVYTASKIDDGKKTPLSEQFEKLGFLITAVSCVIGVLVFVGRVSLYLYTTDDVNTSELIAATLQSLMIAVTLVVCAVPEGLPMAVTMSLAYSMRRMLKTNNLVRKIHACETMGATTVICTDKTGTLTKNQMQVTETLFNEADLDLVMLGMAVNSTALLENKEDGTTEVLGNPTEGALMLWLQAKGKDYLSLRHSVEKKKEEPFSTETKFMATTTADGVRYIKGAPEIVMSMCSDFGMPQSEVEQKLTEWQSKAMRTLGFAVQKEGETAIRFLGVVAIIDPVREDVPAAIRECQQAGIRIIMVTGDNYNTAREIGRQIGLADLDNDIIARAKPLDKKNLVERLQEQGEVVAVTGDGTNDAPALNAAHVGLSMGSGTSVAKEASDITIIDNSFSSICRAVMWGRSLYINIQRFILFQLTVNVAACLVVMIGSFITTEPPLTVTQMLWVNLIMDTFAAVALASLPPSHFVMKDKPRDRNANIIDRRMAIDLIFTGVYFTVLLLLLLWVFVPLNGEEKAVFFTTFIMLQFWNLFCAKGFKAPIRLSFRGAKAFCFIAAVIFIGQCLIVTCAYNFFNISPVDISLIAIVIIVTGIAVLIKKIIVSVLMRVIK